MAAARQPFGDLVRDVGRIKVGEDEHVRPSRRRRARRLAGRDRLGERVVELEFPVYGQAVALVDSWSLSWSGIAPGPRPYISISAPP